MSRAKALLRLTRLRLLVVVGLVCAVAACGPREPELFNLTRGQQGPDEFAILPGKPIEIPQDLSALPPPAPPGTSNRTDATPEADAVAALGGNPARLARDGRAPDGAVVRATTRYGVDPDVREDLAAADLEFRRRNRGRLLERWFGLTTYYDAYERTELNQHREQERWRRAGARSSAAPPPPAD